MNERQRAAALANLQKAAVVNKARPRTLLTCPTCSTAFPVKPSHAAKNTYCSKDCMAAGYRTRMVGDANPNYRRGLPPACLCSWCGASFHSYSRKFCSAKCRQAARPKRVPPPPRVRLIRPLRTPPAPNVGPVREPRPCEVCGATLKTVQRRVCSRKCGGVLMKLGHQSKMLAQSCVQCGTEFKRYPSSSQRFCTYACHIASGGAFRAGLASSKATMRYGAKKDANHVAVVGEMNRLGIWHLDLSTIGRGMPDLIAWIVDAADKWGGKLVMVEIKNPKTAYGRRGLNPIQRKWADQWAGGAIYILRSVEDVAKLRIDRLHELEHVDAGSALRATKAA